MSSGTLLSVVSAGLGVASAFVGLVSLTSAPHAARRLVPFSGGLLMGVAVFGVLPELAYEFQWLPALSMLVAGVLALWAFGRYVHPICPSCSHTHDHDRCTTVLHGFALPMVAAASIHSFLDGVGIGASQHQDAGGLGTVVVFGILLHKLPEGVALGVILSAALRSRTSTLGWCAVIQSATVAGALLETVIASRLGIAWVSYALALAGGSFVYLGFHAVHGEWKRRGPMPAFMPALTGAAGAAALHQGLRVFLR